MYVPGQCDDKERNTAGAHNGRPLPLNSGNGHDHLNSLRRCPGVPREHYPLAVDYRVTVILNGNL